MMHRLHEISSPLKIACTVWHETGVLLELDEFGSRDSSFTFCDGSTTHDACSLSRPHTNEVDVTNGGKR